jgi:hypothetical protein
MAGLSWSDAHLILHTLIVIFAEMSSIEDPITSGFVGFAWLPSFERAELSVRLHQDTDSYKYRQACRLVNKNISPG